MRSWDRRRRGEWRGGGGEGGGRPWLSYITFRVAGGYREDGSAGVRALRQAGHTGGRAGRRGRRLCRAVRGAAGLGQRAHAARSDGLVLEPAGKRERCLPSLKGPPPCSPSLAPRGAWPGWAPHSPASAASRVASPERSAPDCALCSSGHPTACSASSELRRAFLTQVLAPWLLGLGKRSR